MPNRQFHKFMGGFLDFHLGKRAKRTVRKVTALESESELSSLQLRELVTAQFLLVV